MKELTRLKAEQRIDAINAEIEQLESDMKLYKKSSNQMYLSCATKRLQLLREKDGLLQITN